MKIAKTRLFEYHLPLAKPLPGKLSDMVTRDGLLVHIFDEHDNSGWGEIAPLAGLSVETFEQARKETIEVLHRCRGEDLPFLYSLVFQNLSASVNFGIKTAIHNVISALKNVSPHDLLNPQSHDIVPVNGLLTASLNEIAHETKTFIANGYQTLKLKVGRGTLDDDLERVKLVRLNAPAPIAIRLDANCAWNLEDAIYFGKHVSQYDIEYIEEPLNDPNGCEEFYKQTGIPFALDETLIKNNPDSLKPMKGLKAFIIKPTLVGGIFEIDQLAQKARQFGVIPVISSSFESSIGLLILANISSALSPGVSCGLDTASWLANDTLTRPFEIKQGRVLLFDQDQRYTSIDMNMLQEIAS